MTISTTAAKSRYAGDGATVYFPTGFKFLDHDHVKVILRGADGDETVWTEGSEYMLSGAGASGGGTVSVNTNPTDYTPASGETLVVKLAILPQQETSLPLGGAFPSTAVEGMADLAALRDQEIRETLSRVPKFKESTALADVELPEPEAGKVARWNAAGDALENSTLPAFLDGSGAPAGGLGEVDDRYIDNDTGNTYRKTGTSSWTLTGNFEGPVGPLGPQGIQGIQGIQGPAGNDGASVLFGTGAPGGGLGQLGDYYKNTNNGDFYEKTGASTWTLRGNDTGPQGAQGPQGDQGIQGPQGIQGVAGSKVLLGAGVPAAGLGVTSDYYKNTNNGDFYEKTGASTWTLRGNDTGPDGPSGPQGATGNQGTQGVPGADGADGSVIHFGSGVPFGALGVVGDYYKDSSTGDYYEKTGGSTWILRGNDTGPQGDTGATGATGAQGPAGSDGRAILNGTGAPGGGLGLNGDFYLDTAAGAIYGPKASGVWGSATSLVGPQGSQGSPGSDGADGADGIGIAPQGAYSAGTSYSVDHGVTHLGSFWRSLQNGNQGNPPESSPAFWERMVAKGDIGATGATGATGPQGDQGVQGVQGIQGEVGPAGDIGGAADGSAAAPSFAFAVDSDNGFYRIGADSFAATAGGVIAQQWSETGGNVTVSFLDNLVTRGHFGDFAIVNGAPSGTSGSITFDYTGGPDFGLQISGNVTAISVSSWPASGRFGKVTIQFRQPTSGAYTVSFSGIDFGDAGAPTMPTGTGALLEVVLWSRDAGTTVYAAKVFEKAGS